MIITGRNERIIELLSDSVFVNGRITATTSYSWLNPNPLLLPRPMGGHRSHSVGHNRWWAITSIVRQVFIYFYSLLQWSSKVKLQSFPTLPRTTLVDCDKTASRQWCGVFTLFAVLVTPHHTVPVSLLDGWLAGWPTYSISGSKRASTPEITTIIICWTGIPCQCCDSHTSRPPSIHRALSYQGPLLLLPLPSCW